MYGFANVLGGSPVDESNPATSGRTYDMANSNNVPFSGECLNTALPLAKQTPAFCRIGDACYDRGAPLVFCKVPQSWSLRPLPKTALEENKNCYRMNDPTANNVYHENHAKKKKQKSNDFGLRSSVIQKPFRTKKGIPLS